MNPKNRPSDKVEGDMDLARKWINSLEPVVAKRYDEAVAALRKGDLKPADVQRDYNSLSAIRKVQEIVTSLAGNGEWKYEYDPDLEFLRILKEEGWLPRVKP